MAISTTKKKIFKLSNAEYITLSTSGTLTKDGVTYTYSPNDTIYVTPDNVYSKSEVDAALATKQPKNLYFSNVAIAASDWIGNTFAVETFTGDGVTTTFTLQDTVASGTPTVKVGGTATTDFTFDDTNNTITFTTAPADEAEIEVKYNTTPDTGYEDYDYKVVLTCTGVTASTPVDVYYSISQINSSNYSTPESGNNSVTIYSKDDSATTIPLIKAEVVA